jgi:hypothetical protein
MHGRGQLCMKHAGLTFIWQFHHESNKNRLLGKKLIIYSSKMSSSKESHPPLVFHDMAQTTVSILHLETVFKINLRVKTPEKNTNVLCDTKLKIIMSRSIFKKIIHLWNKVLDDFYRVIVKTKTRSRFQQLHTSWVSCTDPTIWLVNLKCF